MIKIFEGLFDSNEKQIAKIQKIVEQINLLEKDVSRLSDDKLREKTKYLMCTQPPNWSAATINYGDIGYLEVKPVIAGIDEWYDGDTQQKYRYNNVWFIKFVPQRPKNVDDIIIQ